jgi:hypothetical protein
MDGSTRRWSVGLAAVSLVVVACAGPVVGAGMISRVDLATGRVTRLTR